MTSSSVDHGFFAFLRNVPFQKLADRKLPTPFLSLSLSTQVYGSCRYFILPSSALRGGRRTEQRAAAHHPRAHGARQRAGGFLIEKGVQGASGLSCHWAVRQQRRQRLQAHAPSVLGCEKTDQTKPTRSVWSPIFIAAVRHRRRR